MATAADLIKASLRKIGVIASGETPSSAEMTDGLSCLNNILEDWSNDGFMIYETVTEEFTFTGGVGAYLIGTGSTWNSARPQLILDVKVKNAAGQVTTDVDVVERDEWNRIRNGSLQSGIPSTCWYNAKFPSGEVNFWPVPSAATTAVVQSLKPLSAIATSATVLSYPPGYRRALEYNLAVEFGLEFGKPIPVEVKEFAVTSKGGIQRNNMSPPLMVSDIAGLQNARCGYDFEAGT